MLQEVGLQKVVVHYRPTSEMMLDTSLSVTKIFNPSQNPETVINQHVSFRFGSLSFFLKKLDFIHIDI